MSDFYVTITDPERAAEFQEVLGTTTLPIRSPQKVEDASGRLFYILDDKQLTREQVGRMCDHIATKFGISIKASQVLIEIDRNGVPILAEHCTLVIKNPQRWI